MVAKFHFIPLYRQQLGRTVINPFTTTTATTSTTITITPTTTTTTLKNIFQTKGNKHKWKCEYKANLVVTKFRGKIYRDTLQLPSKHQQQLNICKKHILQSAKQK